MAKELPIGERIRKARLERGLSVEKLAKKASVNPVTIYRIEKGERKNPHTATVSKLIRVLAKAPLLPKL